MRARQALEIPILDLFPGSPTVVNDHFVHRYVSNTVKQNANPNVEPEIATCHNTELHVEPTWNSEDERKKIVALKETLVRLMVIAVQFPTERVHQILVGKPRYELHEPEGRHDPKYVDENLHFSFKLRVASYKLLEDHLLVADG